MILFIILNTSLLEPYQMQIIPNKNFLNFWFIKMIPFGRNHYYTDSRYYFHERLEVDCR